jgi:uncharacterized RDD family membrane protein YckC
MPGIWEHEEESPLEVKFVEASKGKRIANLLIDYIAFLLAIVMISAVLGMINMDLILALENINGLVDRLVTMFFYASYYMIMESALRGRTIGKMITGTRCVTIHGEEPSLETFLKRSFLRIVPFEAFSFLGEQTGWHDRWSDTMVIDEKLSTFPSDAFEEEYEY